MAGPSVRGIDCSQEVLGDAYHLAAKHGHPRIVFKFDCRKCDFWISCPNF